MKLPMDFKPGEKWAYSNTAYVLLGILVHKITGKFYGEILQEKILHPAINGDDKESLMNRIL
ncbi:MAG: serine hydrolase domain-containing protein [Chitinophagaceae bacterium]